MFAPMRAAFLAVFSFAATVAAQNALPTLRPPYAPAPKDAYFTNQWHLEARTAEGIRLGADHNARGAWSATKGQGITVAIVDDGVDLEHHDLAPNAVASLHRNFDNDTPDGRHASTLEYHGTAAVGLIAAAEDNRGIVGIAPAARFASWRVYPATETEGRTHISPAKMANVFQYATDQVQVQCHNWVETIFPTALIPQSSVESEAIENAVTTGRGGRGVVMTRAAGNQHVVPNHPAGPNIQRNANDDGFVNDPRAIAVGAVRMDGKVTSYSQRGAPILVAGVSGDFDFGFPNLFTTDPLGTAGKNVFTFPTEPDLSGYVWDYLGFTGTSAANPLVAGVCALILSANPALTYRDVQQILIHSSKQWDKTDWDLHRNGAGYWVSHKTGFGVPDAGEAVRVASSWANRPALIKRTIPSDLTAAVRIPDAGLGVHVNTEPPVAMMALPSMGKNADDPTPELPLVDVGLANEPLNINLDGKGALIQRGGANFSVKIANAAAAGAEFAIIYNNTGTTEVNLMGSTDNASIPAVSISKNDGEALKALIVSNPALRVQIRPKPAQARFQVNEAILAEHVGVRVRTSHPLRGDLRITLVSPTGTRSVMQVLTADVGPGPIDWTYWSTHHFYEPAGGLWTLEIVDAPIENFGDLLGADLLLRGTALVDLDDDGLDDVWEVANFAGLLQNGLADPDNDGSWNAREQILATNPTANQTPLVLSISQLRRGATRMAFPSVEGRNYRVYTQTDPGQRFDRLVERAGDFTETEAVIESVEDFRFFRVLEFP